MTTIAGSSRFLGASTLANLRGLAAQTPTVLSNSSSTSLLDSGRKLAVRGFGVSSRARALNTQFLNNSANINAMFSLGVGYSATIEGLQQKILALRAGLSDAQLARSLRAEDTGGVSKSGTGRTVDTQA